MEDNTPKTEVVRVDTTPLATQPMAQTTTAHTVAATASSKLPLILAGVAVIAIAAVAAVILIVKPGQANTSTAAGTGIDASNSTAAVSTLNNRLATLFKSDLNNPNALDSLTGTKNVDAIEFKLSAKGSEAGSDQSFDLVFSGKATSQDGKSGYFEGMGDLKANAPGLKNVSAKIDLQIVDANNIYFRLSKFAPAETAAFLPLIGLEQEKWYKLPIDTGAAANPSNALDLTNVDKNEIGDKPFLINPKSAADRVVFNKTLKCLTAELNPELMKGRQTTKFPVEYCGGDTALPMAIGFNMSEGKTSASFLVELIDIPAFTLAAPAGAIDASNILKGLGVDLPGTTTPSKSNNDSTRLMAPNGSEDYSKYTPEELMSL